jgi:hypothetical protein
MSSQPRKRRRIVVLVEKNEHNIEMSNNQQEHNSNSEQEQKQTRDDDSDFRISLDQRCDICHQYMLGDEEVVPHPKERYLFVHKFCVQLYQGI